MTTFELNGRTISVHSPDDTPLLWVIRDEIGLTGTKFGCGSVFAAPARCMWKDARRDPASPRLARSPPRRSRLSKGSIRRADIRCKRRGLSCRPRSAGTVSRDKSCRQRRC
jgi:hypothetical protein